MCGIAGILGATDKALVRRMCDTIAHRGPDGDGTWVDDGVTLGHRRLSIIDIAGGDQPMESHDGRYCIVYNGEIYNHRALRKELEELGHTFRSDHSDTEVLLEGFRQWGTELLGRLEGMFAFALWDTQTKELTLARDPFGIKPLFFACTGKEFVFASEQKALFVHPEVIPIISQGRIKERAALEFLTGQATLFVDVHQLPPGSWATLTTANCKNRIAWQPYYTVPTEEFASIESAAAAIKDRFVGSVQEQLMADVPLGVILSGGLDSTVVAAAAGANLSTFTIAEHEDIADFKAAKQIAQHLGTDHHETFFDFETMWKNMPRYTWHNENINHTEFFFLPLFERMQQHVKVGLCGQGSDELWGGYDRYKDPLGMAKERLRRIRAANPPHAEELCDQVQLTHTSGSSLAEWDQQGQLNNFQLRLVDRNSMAHSVEVRVPFLSKPLHQASRGVPWGWKQHEGIEKWIFRKACEELNVPHDLLWRPKLPAGRATAPGVMEQFEQAAKRLRPDKGHFQDSSERLVHDLFVHMYTNTKGYERVALEDL